jgi:hypothetical protein
MPSDAAMRPLPAIPPPPTTRHRLRTESEMKFADVDARSAACYADAEDLVAKLAEVTEQVAKEAEASGIPDEVDALQDTSAVHHMETLRERLSTGEIEALKRPL